MWGSLNILVQLAHFLAKLMFFSGLPYLIWVAVDLNLLLQVSELVIQMIQGALKLLVSLFFRYHLGAQLLQK